MIIGKEKLSLCDPKLSDLFFEVSKIFNVNIICGLRTKEEQDELFKTGRSKLKFPESKHNLKQGRNEKYSLAVDVAPHPIDWKDLNRFYFLAGVVFAIAKERNIKIRWGGDWDGNKNFRDQSFNDFVHFEVVE